MNRETRDWLEGLLDLATAARRGTPQSADDASAAAERTIHAAHLADWLGRLDLLRARRRAFAESDPARDPVPAIVLTTTPVGIGLVAELVARRDPAIAPIAGRLACVTEAEYRRHAMRSPDPEFLLHLNHWTWVKTRVPEQRWGEFARHPLGPEEAYWLHRTGTAGAGAADVRGCDLWRFDGRAATLLEAGIVERGVGRDGETTAD
jgi:hypothetical protein